MAALVDLPVSADAVVIVDQVSKKFSRGLKRALRHAATDIGREFTWWKSPVSELREGEFWALRDVSIELRRGESLAVIGANGAGKSTLLKLVSGLLKPDRGSIRVRGKLRAMIELGAAFNPVLTGRDNIFLQGALYGYRREELNRQLDAIIDFAGLDAFIDAPVQQYSDGMRARLGFAVAINLEPDILLVDEVLAVGDLAFQNKCLRRIRRYLDDGGSLIFVGHGSHQVQSACRTGLVLVQGQTAFRGTTIEAVDFYLRLQSPPVSMRGELSGQPTATANHSGSGVRIESMETRAAGDRLLTGGSLEVAATCMTGEEIEQVSLGFTFLTADGTTIAGGMAMPPVTLPAGRTRLELNIPNLFLLPGYYMLRLFLVDIRINYPIAVSGWDDAPHVVVVESSPNEFVNGSALAGIAAVMDAEWLPSHGRDR